MTKITARITPAGAAPAVPRPSPPPDPGRLRRLLATLSAAARRRAASASLHRLRANPHIARDLGLPPAPQDPEAVRLKLLGW